MNKFDNHVFLEICSITVDLTRKSPYYTHKAFCKGLLRSIKAENLSGWEKASLVKIFERLEHIFGFQSAEMNDYILAYLESDRIEEFERVVLMTRMLFPFTGG